MSLLDRARAFMTRQKAAGDTASVIPPTWPMDWWQKGYTPRSSQGTAAVEACVSAYGQTMAQLPGRHYEINPDTGVKSYNTTSRLARVLAKPNEFQTRSDFVLNVVYSVLLTGNAYWVGNSFGNERPNKIYLLDPNVTRAEHDRETGDIYYSTSGQFLDMAGIRIEDRAYIPSRYVGQLRLYTPRDPLVGVTPLTNAAMSVSVNDAIVGQQSTFFNNMSRPSGILSTDMELTKDQMIMLRDAWEKQSKDMNSGRVPILGSGIKWDPMTISSQDAQVVEAWRMSVQDISSVFRVPPMLINNMENSTFDNAETLMRFWLSSGLGFLVNHYELAMAAFYGLDDRYEGVEMNTEVLLRSDMQARLEALGSGVTKGVYSPNEARRIEGLPPVDGGDMPRVQQQMVPLDAPIEATQPAIAPPAETETVEAAAPRNPKLARAMLKRDLRKRIEKHAA